MRPVVLEGAIAVTLDPTHGTGRWDLAVADGRIAAVAPHGGLAGGFEQAERLDARDRVLLPGLVNAHLHPELQVLKGAVEGLDLHGWARAADFEAALQLLGTEELRHVQTAAIRAALGDALLGGTTCVAAYGVTAGADDTAADALRELGLRGHVTVRDIAFEPVAGAAPATTLDPPRMYRLHAEEALSDAELAAAAAALARGERIVMHAAETRLRVRLARQRFGTTPIRLLERWRLLSPRMLLSHAVHVDAAERELIARHGAFVIASPSAELKLADGLAPIAEYLANGIPVALGTDAAICNNSNDMFLECRQLGLAQSLAAGPAAIHAGAILRCATVHGAAALGHGADFGSLAPGRFADLVLVDAHGPRLRPLVLRDGFSNVEAALVYAAVGGDVTDVMVGGRWLVRERRLLTADAPALWSGLDDAASELHERLVNR